MSETTYCECACGEEIIIKKFHMWGKNKIPKFKDGHWIRLNNPMKNPNSIKKMIETNSKSGHYKRISERQKKNNVSKRKDVRKKHSKNMKKYIRNNYKKFYSECHGKNVIEKRENTKKQRGVYERIAVATRKKNLENNPSKYPHVRLTASKRLKENPIADYPGVREARSKRLKENPIAKYCRNPSKPQLALFKIIKEWFHPFDVFCNHRVRKKDGGNYYLDVAIPMFKLNFEYDGKYWHSLNKESDRIRDLYLKSIGWSVIRLEGA